MYNLIVTKFTDIVSNYGITDYMKNINPLDIFKTITSNKAIITSNIIKPNIKPYIDDNTTIPIKNAIDNIVISIPNDVPNIILNLNFLFTDIVNVINNINFTINYIIKVLPNIKNNIFTNKNSIPKLISGSLNNISSILKSYLLFLTIIPYCIINISNIFGTIIESLPTFFNILSVILEEIANDIPIIIKQLDKITYELVLSIPILIANTPLFLSTLLEATIIFITNVKYLIPFVAQIIMDIPMMFYIFLNSLSMIINGSLIWMDSYFLLIKSIIIHSNKISHKLIHLFKSVTKAIIKNMPKIILLIPSIGKTLIDMFNLLTDSIHDIVVLVIDNMHSILYSIVITFIYDLYVWVITLNVRLNSVIDFCNVMIHIISEYYIAIVISSLFKDYFKLYLQIIKSYLFILCSLTDNDIYIISFYIKIVFISMLNFISTALLGVIEVLSIVLGIDGFIPV